MNIQKRAKKYIGKTINYYGFGGKVIDIVKVSLNKPLDGHCCIKWNDGKSCAVCFKCLTWGGYNVYVEIPKKFRNVKIEVAV